MTAIKRIYEDQQKTTQVFPQTHEKAVVDDYGNTLESKLGQVQDMINQAQLEIGAVPIDLTPTLGNTTHVVSSDAVFKATKYNLTDVDISGATELSYHISSDKWYVSSGVNAARRCILIQVSPNGIYRLNNTTRVSANYAILKNNTINAGSSVEYATGCTREATDGIVDLVIPVDGNYIYLMTHTSSDAITWDVDEAVSIYAQSTGSDAFKAMSQKAVTEALSSIGTSSTYGIVDLSQYQETIAAIGDTTWLNTDDRKGKFIPVNAGDCFRITCDYDVEATTYAFLKTDEWAVNETIQFAYRESRHTLLKGETNLLKAPYDAKYLFVTTFITTDRSPIVEKINASEYESLISQSRLFSRVLAEGRVVSDSEYLYAFFPFALYINNNVKAVFAGNKTTTDGDSTVNTNKIVLADFDIMTGQVTNTEMPAFTAFQDGEGNALSGVTRAYNNCVYTQYGNDIGMFGAAGDGSTAGYSYCYKQSFNSTIYTRCHLVYDNTEVEFTGDNYRQMLYDMGWTSSKVTITKAAVDCTAIYYTGSKYYVVMCGFTVKGENTELPLVLLESTDLATWTVVCMLGTSMHKASEIRCVVLNSKVYVIYRRIVNATNQAAVGNGYGIGVYSLADGSALNEKIIYSYIQSLPIICHANGSVWFGFNETPYMSGKPSNVTYPYGRQQMAIYKVRNDDNSLSYQYSVESPTGINYPTIITVYGKNGNTAISNIDRVYMAWSEDRRNLNYRQINNVCIANVTPLFGIEPLNGGN